MPSTEIIIIKYNAPEFERDCIRSVIDNTELNYHLTVFDNYETNYGLSTIWNKLIAKSEADYIVLLNSDTVVEPKWLKNLVSLLTKMNAGAVGPVSNRAGSRQTQSRGLSFTETDMLSGFCLAFKKKVWQEVGGFDENYFLYFEDDDFCKKLTKAGYKLYINNEVFIHHIQRASSDKRTDIKEQFVKSKNYFENKWKVKWRP